MGVWRLRVWGLGGQGLGWVSNWRAKRVAMNVGCLPSVRKLQPVVS